MQIVISCMSLPQVNLSYITVCKKADLNDELNNIPQSFSTIIFAVFELFR